MGAIIKIIIAVIIAMFLYNYVHMHGLHIGMRAPVEAPSEPELIKLDQDMRSGPTTAPYIGDANANNIVIEFFDYNCPYCKDIDSDVGSLAGKNVKVVFFEMPILGANSYDASKMALAVYNLHPDKYYEFHHRLMSGASHKTKAEMLQIAKDVGVTEDLETEMNNSLYDEVLSTNRTIANNADIRGTPSFVVNGVFARRVSEVEDYIK